MEGRGGGVERVGCGTVFGVHFLLWSCSRFDVVLCFGSGVGWMVGVVTDEEKWERGTKAYKVSLGGDASLRSETDVFEVKASLSRQAVRLPVKLMNMAVKNSGRCIEFPQPCLKLSYTTI